MASPPFALSTTTPGDSDIVSQFPLNERTLRDIIQSWILANHDTNGNHAVATFPWASTPATPGASLITLYADAKGRLKYVTPDGVVNLVGVPPGMVFWGAPSAIPVGYLLADGSAVSRATYSDLFTAISTDYGVGDGSTTFNVPDITGRVIIGEDGSSTRIDATTFGTTPVRAAVGGGKNITLLSTNLPPQTPSGSIVTSSGSNNLAVTTGTINSGFVSAGATSNPNQYPSVSGGWGSINSLTSTFTGAAFAGQISTPFSRIQPGIILRALIKV